MNSFGNMSNFSSQRGDVIPKGYSSGQMQQFTPEQLELFKQMFSQVSPDSYTSRLARGDQDLFNEIEDPALRQFSELQGNLASRFSGMGSGARNSSGFQNASNQASSDFASSLQSQRQQLMQKAIQDLMGMSEGLLNQRPYERFLNEKRQKDSSSSSGWGGLIGAGLGGVGGFLAGGPAGALAGAGLGQKVGSSF